MSKRKKNNQSAEEARALRQQDWDEYYHQEILREQQNTFGALQEELARGTIINIQHKIIIRRPEDYETACEVSRLREEHERLWDAYYNQEPIPDIPDIENGSYPNRDLAVLPVLSNEFIPDIPAIQLSSVTTSPFSEEPPDMPSFRGEIEIPGGILNFSNANGPLNNESTDRQRLRTMPMFSKESSDSPYCRSCGQKKNLVDGLCERCTHIEALMKDTLDETRKVDFSGHVGQRQEINEDEIANMRRYGVFAPHFACPERQGAPEPMGTITYTNPTQGETVRITQEEINEFNSSAMYLGQDGQWHNISELET